MTPFDFVFAINGKKNRDLIRGSENPELASKDYNPWIINKAFSLTVDTIMYSNEMNLRAHLDKQMQNAYYINTIRPGFRKTEWVKKGDTGHDIDCIMEYYNVTQRKADEILRVLTKDQLALLKRKIIKGGLKNDLRSKSTSRGETL